MMNVDPTANAEAADAEAEDAEAVDAEAASAASLPVLNQFCIQPLHLAKKLADRLASLANEGNP